MAETYFNLQDGRLFIGAAAIAEGMEQPGNELVPLAELILNANFQVPEKYDRQRGKQWSQQDCVDLGHWIMGLLAEQGATHGTEEVRLHAGHIERLNILGIGPNEEIFERRFGPMWAYGEALGIRTMRRGEKYAHWTTADFIEYAAKLAQEIGGKPTEGDYQDAYRRLQGPSRHVIGKQVGGIRRLNELIGYPDIQGWDDEDYIDWGVKVMWANGNAPVSREIVRLLSKRKRGPSECAISSRFGSMTKFKRRVAEEEVVQSHELAERNAGLLAEYEALQQAGQLCLPKETDEIAKLRATAKAMVIQRCAPQLGQDQAASLVRLSPARFVEALLGKSPKLTAGIIESTAVRLGVFDYIWPFEEWRQHLKA